MNPISNRFLPLLLLSLLCLTGSPARASTPIDEREAAEPEGQVEVSNISGEIVVTGWDKPEVAVTGTLGDGVERLDFIRDGALTTIEVVYPRNGRSSEGSDLQIYIPKASALEVRAVSAHVEVSGVEGRQRLQSVSGDVTTEVFAADVEAETVSGDVAATGRNVSVHTSLNSVSGRIETRGVSGEIDAITVSGRIDAEAAMLSRARLKTTSGRITLDAGLADNGRFDLSSTSGRVDLNIDHDRDLDVDAETFSGGIGNCLGAETTRSRYSPERSLRFQTGEANRTVRIRTMSAHIEICADERSR